jgi:MATE family multidrug resistance protein
MTLPTRDDLRSLLALAGPIIFIQVGMMAFGVVDTMMVGRVSPNDLAAIGLGNMYFFGCVVLGFGVLLAVDPILSQAVGANDPEGVARGVQRGLVLCGLVCIPISLLLIPGEFILTLLGQPADVVSVAAPYARANIAGVFPMFAFGIGRSYLQAVGRTAPVAAAVIFANLIHVPLNWMFIFGKAGLPAMGAVGSGWATSLSRWIMLFLVVGSILPMLRPWRNDTFQWKPLQRMLRLGLPMGFQMLVEFSTFAAAGVLMGWIGTVPMAGHQIALNLASLTFMVPLGVSIAASVFVGRGVGAEDMPAARRAASAAIVCGGGFMMMTATAMLTLPYVFARAYTNESEVIAIAMLLIPMAGIFQVFDGLQVVLSGILRGLGETRLPLLFNVVGFWVIGFPISLLLRQSPTGIWWGLVVGLAAVAALLLGAVWFTLKKTVSRVVI